MNIPFTKRISAGSEKALFKIIVASRTCGWNRCVYIRWSICLRITFARRTDSKFEGTTPPPRIPYKARTWTCTNTSLAHTFQIINYQLCVDVHDHTCITNWIEPFLQTTDSILKGKHWKPISGENNSDLTTSHRIAALLLYSSLYTVRSQTILRTVRKSYPVLPSGMWFMKKRVRVYGERITLSSVHFTWRGDFDDIFLLCEVALYVPNAQTL